MDVVGLAGRLEFLAPSSLVEGIAHRWVDPWTGGGGGGGGEVGLLKRALITWVFLYVTAIGLYFVSAGGDYLLWFVLFKRGDPETRAKVDAKTVWSEIRLSVLSVIVMSGFSTPPELLIQLGYSKVYTRVEDYGWTYLVLSPLLFLIFSDFIIYFIHRGLHHPLLYRRFHKLHHSFVHTSPFAAFAFHPVDGYLQGVAYHLFVFIFPFHYLAHLFSLCIVSCWTVNIHDGVGLNFPGINGAGHHTIHHTQFTNNYGQYFTFWDRVCGTYKDPTKMKRPDPQKKEL